MFCLLNIVQSEKVGVDPPSISLLSHSKAVVHRFQAVEFLYHYGDRKCVSCVLVECGYKLLLSFYLHFLVFQDQFSCSIHCIARGA